MMPQLDVRYVKRYGGFSFCRFDYLVGVDEKKLRLRINESFNEPRAGDSIHFGMGSRYIFHSASPNERMTFTPVSVMGTVIGTSSTVKIEVHHEESVYSRHYCSCAERYVTRKRATNHRYRSNRKGIGPKRQRDARRRLPRIFSALGSARDHRQRAY